MIPRIAAPPPDSAAIARELERAVHRWREIDERIAALTVLRLALDTRDNHPDAATITLTWTDQPGTPRLEVQTVYDHHCHEITSALDDDHDAAGDLTESNQHIWQPLLTHDPGFDTYRLDIASAVAAAPVLAPLTSNQPDPREL